MNTDSFIDEVEDNDEVRDIATALHQDAMMGRLWNSEQQQTHDDEKMARDLQLQYDREYASALAGPFNELDTSMQGEEAATQRQQRSQENLPSASVEYSVEVAPRAPRAPREPRTNVRGRPRRAASPAADYETLLNLGQALGDVNRGLSLEAIGRLPVRKYRPEQNGKQDEKDQCSVCLMDYNKASQLKCLPCFHSFHVKCIDKWLKKKKTCPVCLSEVDAGEKEADECI